jgi:hypothetical protein
VVGLLDVVLPRVGCRQLCGNPDRPPGHLRSTQRSLRAESRSDGHATRCWAGRGDQCDQCGAAIVFPALNEVLNAAFAVPDAVAQELAASGDPVRASAAGVNSAAGSVNAAVTVVADAIGNAVSDIRNAADQPSGRSSIARSQKPSATPTATLDNETPVRRLGTTAKHAAKPASPRAHPLRDLASKVSLSARSAAKNVSERTNRVAASKHSR